MTIKFRFQFLSIITILSMLITMPQPALAEGVTFNVPTTEYPTIQSAIDAAGSGDIINIAAGTFVENVIVNKSLTIVGAGQGSTIIQPAVSNPNPCTGSSLCGGIASNVFLVQADNVIIHDLTVDGDNPLLTSGIVRTGSGSPADLDARNGIITNSNAGTYNNLEVYNVTVQNIYLRGIYTSTGSFNFHDNTVTNVQGDQYSIGMFAWYGPGVFQSNHVSYANDAISANHSKGIQFLNNTVTHSGSGVHTDNSGDGGGVADLIQGNQVDCTGTPGAYGIWVFVPYIAPTFNNNTVINCDVGISAWGTGAAVTTQFTNNTVTGNLAVGAAGVYITTSMAGYGYSDVYVNFSDNVITNYETGVYLTADETTWDPDPYLAKTINATFHENQIFNNTTGVDKGTGGTIVNDFINNWWGSETGPSAPDNLTGTGNPVVSGINFSPWCKNESCTGEEPPVLPSSFYGEIHISDSAPNSGDLVEAYLPGVTGVVASGTITTYLGNLVYSFDIPGMASTEGDLITFKINGRVVATALWHSGTHVSLNIHPPEALPGGAYVGNEGSAIAFNGSANDSGADAATYEWDWDNDGTYDTIGQAANHTWTQDGAYTVGLKVTDAQGGVGTATVAVTVNNAAPVVNAGDDFAVAEDAPFSFAGTATDAGADTLTYEWDFDYDGTTFNVDASGSLTPSHTYTVVGAHTAALRVNDGIATVIDTVVVTVTNVNDAPEITGQLPLSTDEDTPLTITLGDLTVEDPDNTYPADFTLTVLSGTNYTVDNHTITPELNFFGTLTVSVKVNDGITDSSPYNLSITVNAVNDTPLAYSQSLNTDEDTPLPITLTGSDVETVSLTYAVTVEPLHGDLSGSIPNLLYTPDANYNGTDSFKFTASDGVFTSPEATITITVGGVNDAPIITGQVPLSVNEDTPLTINLTDLTVSDVDNDTYPIGFTLTVLDGANYSHIGNVITPTQNFHGPLSVQVQVNDGLANSNIFNLTVTVVDVLPTALNAGGPYTAVSGQPVTLTGSATCEPTDDCAFTWDLDNDGEYDDAVGNSTTHTWYAVGNYTVGMKVTDDDGNFATATATVNISAVTHSITLVPGWNLVSFNVHPTNTSIGPVLASIDGNFDLVYAWDATGAHSNSGNWLKYDNIAYSPDNLTTLDEGMGFWIHMTAADVLEVAGSLPTTTNVALSDNAGGWNLVGYPSAANGTLPAILTDNGVGSDFSLIYAYHPNETGDPWKLFDRTSPFPVFNDLTQLSAGWGYWVKVSADHTWTVQYVAP